MIGLGLSTVALAHAQSEAGWFTGEPRVFVGGQLAGGAMVEGRVEQYLRAVTRPGWLAVARHGYFNQLGGTVRLRYRGATR